MEERIPVVLQVLVVQLWFLSYGSPGASAGGRNIRVLTPWLLFVGGKCGNREAGPPCSVSWDIASMQQEFVFSKCCICLHGSNCWEVLVLCLRFASFFYLITVCYIQCVCLYIHILYTRVVPDRKLADSSLEKNTHAAVISANTYVCNNCVYSIIINQPFPPT